MVVCLYRLKMVVFPVEKTFIHALAIEHRLINREGLTGSSLYYQLTYSIFIYASDNLLEMGKREMRFYSFQCFTYAKK